MMVARCRGMFSLMVAGGLAFGLGERLSFGQDALGDGRALDANQQVGSGGRNPDARDFGAEVRLRNAIVTGNAPGGRSFRGSVGYSAEFDFRASTGGDTLFDFQRDSLYSGLATRGVRGITGIQTQLGLTTDLEARGRTPLALSRPGAGASSLTVRDPAGVSSDVFGQIEGTLRSTAGAYTRESEMPRPLGFRRSGDGRALTLVASPLAGVRELLADNRSLLGPGADDATLDLESLLDSESLDATLGGDAVPADPLGVGRRPFAPGPRAGEAEDGEVRPGRVESGVESGARNERADRRVEATPLGRERLLSRLFSIESGLDGGEVDGEGDADGTGAGGAGADEALRRADRTLRSLSERLNRPATPGVGDEGSFGVGGSDDAREGDGEGEDEGEAEAADEEEMSRAVEMIRRNRTRVEQLAPLQGESKRAFVEHMRTGERWLLEGRWFDAEERFTAALTIDPSSLEAEVGRINAQIGAGLYTSAALNLRMLYRDYPEMLSVVYDESLLPRGERLAEIITQLREGLSRAGDRGKDAALLLAFLGRQTDRSALIEDALSRMREINSGANQEQTALEELIQRVWGG